MAERFSVIQAVALWRSVLVSSVRNAEADLTVRQLAVLATVYVDAPPHTVRGLADTLSISKPAVTRALDRLSHLDLLRRKRDILDKRNVLVQRTVKGSVFLSERGDAVAEAMNQATRELQTEAPEAA